MDAEWSVRQGLFPVDIDPKLALARVGQDILPTYLNTASYYEIVRIPHIGPMTTRKIIEARKNIKIRYISNLKWIIGASLARRVKWYVDLKDRKLIEF